MSDKGNEGVVLERPITVIRQQFNYLVELLSFGKIDKEEFLREAEELLCFDRDGTAWMISLENGNWYKLVGDKPVLGEPPEVLYRPVEVPEKKHERADRFCGKCGKPLSKGKSFCTHCGEPARG